MRAGSSAEEFPFGKRAPEAKETKVTEIGHRRDAKRAKVLAIKAGGGWWARVGVRGWRFPVRTTVLRHVVNSRGCRLAKHWDRRVRTRSIVVNKARDA